MEFVVRSVVLPKLVEADDYHDFIQIEDAMNKVFNDRVFVTEVGFDSTKRQYVGIVYLGELPSNIKYIFDSSAFQ
jgi:hypothetical protein